MYRKEEIFNLLKDPEGGDDVNHDKPALKWHKVIRVETVIIIVIVVRQ